MSEKLYRGKTMEQHAAELAELGHEGEAVPLIDDQTHAEIQALVDEIMAGEEGDDGGLLGPSGELIWNERNDHPLSKTLKELVKKNAVAIAYNYLHLDFASSFYRDRMIDAKNKLRQAESQESTLGQDDVEELQPRTVLTIRDCADELRCSPQAVRNMIKTGKLRATQIGTGSQRKAYTIKRSDLEALGRIQEETTAKPTRRKNSGQDDNRWGL